MFLPWPFDFDVPHIINIVGEGEIDSLEVRFELTSSPSKGVDLPIKLL